MAEEDINSLVRTLPECVMPIFNNFKNSYENFLHSAKAWKNSTGEERQHHLAAADKNSTEALEHLMKIVKIAEETKNQSLKNRITSIMSDVIEARKMIGLKT